MQQQTLEESIQQFENWQANISAKRMRIAALLRYGMTKRVRACSVAEGQPVICNGYQGTIARVLQGQLRGMAEVRLQSGLVCVPIRELCLMAAAR